MIRFMVNQKQLVYTVLFRLQIVQQPNIGSRDTNDAERSGSVNKAITAEHLKAPKID